MCRMRGLALAILLSLTTVTTLPSPESCGVDPGTGEKRQPGDAWTADCNRCRCLAGDKPACTKKLCESQFVESKGCKDEEDNSRDEGETWKDGDNACSCKLGLVTCSPLIIVTDVLREVEENKCGVDNVTGVQRGPGDRWKEDCNTCKCLNTGLPGCTKRLCLPRTVESCGLNPESGEKRKPGDAWAADCNRCQCLAEDKPACTKKLCEPAVAESKGCKDKEENPKNEGEAWKDGDNSCSCKRGLVTCTPLIVVTDVLQKEVEENKCGVDSVTGVQRGPGDNWREDCNTCKCVSNSLPPACTQKLCLKNECGVDSETGEERKVGDEWPVDCNLCSCVRIYLPPSCTEIACASEDKGVSRVNFPGISSAASCADQQGTERKNGETWKEDCNTCRCLKGRSSCSRQLCPKLPEDLAVLPTAEELASQPTEAFLFHLESSRDVSSTAQCQQNGVQNCRAVVVDKVLAKSLKVGDKVSFLPSTNIEMTLSSTSTSSSGSLSLVFSLPDLSQAIITLGASTSPSVYGSVRPFQGPIYFLESCGLGCNVLYERSPDFFNQYED